MGVTILAINAWLLHAEAERERDAVWVVTRTSVVVYESTGDWLTRACGSEGVRQWDDVGERNRRLVAVCRDGRVVDSRDLRLWKAKLETGPAPVGDE